MATHVRRAVAPILGPTARDIQRMIEDGRLCFEAVIDGRKVYRLDRKKLGMIEEEETPVVTATTEAHVEVTDKVELDDELKPVVIKMKSKTLESKIKRMNLGVKKFKR